MNFVSDLRLKAARERAWLIGDPVWMRQWLLDQAQRSTSRALEFKSGYAARCCDMASRFGGAASVKVGNPHWEEQPRVPSGSPEGGEWTKTAGDLTGLPFPEEEGGHHFVNRGLFNNLPLPAETRKVFQSATTGPLQDEFSNRYDGMHRAYNRTIEELFQKYVKDNSIVVESMTPAQARAFLQEVLGSSESSVRNFNMRVYMREIMQMLKRRLPNRE